MTRKVLIFSAVAAAFAVTGMASVALVVSHSDSPPSEAKEVDTAVNNAAPGGGEADSTGAVPGTAAQRTVKPRPSPTPSFDVSSLKRGDLALELTVEPSCARRGDAVTAKLKAVPGAYVSLIVGYSDGQSYGTWYAGPTAPDGTLTYPWVVPPNASFGEGHIFAAGHDPATEHSGTVAAVFHVTEKKGC